MVTATAREENGEFCVVVAPEWITYGCQIEPAIRPIWVIYTGLIGFNPRRLQGTKRGMSSHATDLSIYAKSSSSSSVNIPSPCVGDTDWFAVVDDF